MGPELLLAIDACVTESGALLTSIAKKVIEVVRLKKNCQILGNDAVLLQTLLVDNTSAIDDFLTLDRILTCLRGIDDFVKTCATFTLLDEIGEVMFKRKFQRLRGECRALRELFCFEATVTLLKREEKAVKLLTGSQQKLLEGQKTQVEILQDLHCRLGELKDARRRGRLDSIVDSARRSGLSPDFTTGTQFQWGPGAASGIGTLVGFGNVECSPIVDRGATQIYLDIYKSVQAGAYVRRLLGILLDQDIYYAVLEPIRGQLTLAEWSTNPDRGTIPALKLAFGISKSVAWLHKAELLTKTLTDHNILVNFCEDGSVAPLLTDLESSRHFLQRSAGTPYDVRYEAPEYQFTGEHSTFTDVWLTGILIWQCVSGSPPFGMRNKEITPGSPDAQTMREQLNEVRLNRARGPLTSPNPAASPLLGDVYDLCQQCCHPEPMLRPTSAAIAQRLQDLWLTATTKGLHVTPVVPKRESGDSISAGRAEKAIKHHALEDLLLKEIKKARAKNPTLKFVQHVPDPAIPPEDFTSYLNDELEEDQERLPIKSFLVGAALWWQLVPRNLIEDAPKSAALSGLMLGDNYQRARLCLDYLEYAAASGYEEAYLEIANAHAKLYQLYKTVHGQLKGDAGHRIVASRA